MYMGFSVPLLDVLIKTIILDWGFDINTSTNPVMLFSIIAVANGTYIVGHNT